MLGGGDDVATRRVHDQDSLACRRGHVDVVHANSGATHNAQPPAGLEDRLGHPGLAADDESIEVGDALYQLRLRELAHYCDLAGSTQPLETVFGDGVGDQDPEQVAYRVAAATP